jgi:ankyrin repeat protein
MSVPLDLERLRKEAKSILKQCRAGNPAFVERVRSQLHLAVWGSDPAQMGFFLAHGAVPNIKRADGKTPYFRAVRAGNQAMADVLRAWQRPGGCLTPPQTVSGSVMQPADLDADGQDG